MQSSRTWQGTGEPSISSLEMKRTRHGCERSARETRSLEGICSKIDGAFLEREKDRSSLE
jgi:hypothetical protein